MFNMIVTWYYVLIAVNTVIIVFYIPMLAIWLAVCLSHAGIILGRWAESGGTHT